MQLTEFIDFGIFFILLSLLFIIFSQTLSRLHRVYVLLHISFMHWSLFQFASYITNTLALKFLLVQTSYLVLSSISVVFYIFSIYLIHHTDFFKTWKFKLSLLPSILLTLFIIINPNHLFIQEYIGPAANKLIGQGLLFNALTVVSVYYVILICSLLIQSYRKPFTSSRIKRNIVFTLIGMSITFGFAIIDLIYNIILMDVFNSYFPFLSVGMLISACYMTFKIIRNNDFNIITLAHRDVVNTITVGILIIDRDRNIVEMNTHISKLISLKVDDILDYKYVMDAFPHNDWEGIKTLYDSHKSNRHASISYELVLTRNPDSYALIQCHPIINRSDTLLGYMYTVQDMTQMKSLVESTKYQNLLLHQRNSELIHTQEKLYEANSKLESIATTDYLTECYNRRYLIQFLEYELPKNVEKNIPFSVIIVDIDYFKTINDRFGHLAGDYVLKYTARKLKKCIGPSDVLARFGGEEFIIYFNNITEADALAKIELIKEEIEKNEIWLERTQNTVSVTVSIGLVSIDDFNSFVGKSTDNLQYDIMALADQALYEAKDQGRNTIVRRNFILSQS